MPGRKLLLHRAGPTVGRPGHKTTYPGRFWFSEPRPYVSHDPRLGRVGCVSPEFIIRNDGSWLGRFVCIERITHRSSMQRLKCGNSSLTSIPELPCFENLKGEGISVPFVLRIVFTSSAGGAWPACVWSAGFGSNVSTCEGPPFMNR